MFVAGEQQMGILCLAVTDPGRLLLSRGKKDAQRSLVNTSIRSFVTGKYQPGDEDKINPAPYLTCESFPEAVEHILGHML